MSKYNSLWEYVQKNGGKSKRYHNQRFQGQRNMGKGRLCMAKLSRGI